MKQLVSFITLLLIFLCSSNAIAQSRINFNNQELFLNGANFAWINFARDIGPGFTDFERFEEIFQDVHANGGNAMRLWLHTTGASTPKFDAEGMVIGPGENAIEDLRQILDIAWRNKVGVLACLWSFDMLRISNGETITSRSMSMLKDTTYTHAYINNSLIPMVEALKGHPAIIAWEIFNEPEGMSEEHGWDFNLHVPMSDIQRFINLCAGAIHRTDPQVQVTNGAWSFISLTDVSTVTLAKVSLNVPQLNASEKARIENRFAIKYGELLKTEEIFQHMKPLANYNYYSDSRLIAAGGDVDGTLDFYTVHYYDWAGTALSPFHNPASYWNLDKAVAVNEFGISETFGIPAEELYDTLFKNGYAGTMAWSWTDTDISSVEDMLASMLDMKTKYPDDVTIIYWSGTITSFTADPPVIEKGESSLLSWTTSMGSAVTLNGEPVDENGNFEVSPDTTTTYKLIASGDITDSSEVTIEVLLPGTIVYFVAEPTQISIGESSLLSWHAVTGSSVTLNGIQVAETDSLEVNPSADSTFTLIAMGDVIDTSSVIINVIDPLDINRALNQPAFASSGEPNSDVADPALAVDGDTRTRWSSNWFDDEWIYVDLGESYDIERVLLNWEVAYGRIYKIEVSDDAENWTEIYSTTAGDGGIDDITNFSGTGRYVRMHGLVRSTQWGFSLWEFEVYGIPSVVGIAGEDQRQLPGTFRLEQNYPNPFNLDTKIKYSISSESEIKLEVFNTLGRKVATLVDTKQAKGSYTIIFSGKGLASGFYYYRLWNGKNRIVKRMLLTK